MAARLGSSQLAEMQQLVKEKLREASTGPGDEVLPEYIMVMIQNDKGRKQMAHDLDAFLGSGAPAFTEWLWEKLHDVAARPRHRQYDARRNREPSPRGHAGMSSDLRGWRSVRSFSEEGGARQSRNERPRHDERPRRDESERLRSEMEAERLERDRGWNAWEASRESRERERAAAERRRRESDGRRETERVRRRWEPAPEERRETDARAAEGAHERPPDHAAHARSATLPDKHAEPRGLPAESVFDRLGPRAPNAVGAPGAMPYASPSALPGATPGCFGAFGGAILPKGGIGSQAVGALSCAPAVDDEVSRSAPRSSA